MLLLLTMVLSVVNYKTTFSLVQNQIEKQSLPLSLDNIYTDIQKQIIEPYLITSMMANDTFVKEWIQTDDSPEKIQKYLSSIKEEYGLLSAILVHDKTKNYYTQNGFLETLNPENRDNKWYFRFKESQKSREINIDTNVKIDKSIIMFMNNKILDENSNLIGITSTGVKIDSIDKMLQMFREKYHLEVYLFDKNLNIILTQKNTKVIDNLSSEDEFMQNRDKLLSEVSTMFEYKRDGEEYIVNTKYISELDIHILVKAKLSDFTTSIEKTFYFNLFISILTTIIVALVILYIVESSIMKLQKSNAQKDILLKEVHHRVKNNLNVIASILGLQANGKVAEIKEELYRSKSRIESIAIVHEMLYKQEDYEEITFNDYVLKLKQLILSMHLNSSNTTISLRENHNLTLPLNIMIQFGLIINEMLTNSLKYARNSEGIKIDISLSMQDDSFVFSYIDNGENTLEEASLKKSSGLGFRLIDLSVQQLNGSLTKHYNSGLHYEVRFKND